MLQKYPSTRNHHIAIDTLLDYALKVSDNNACDVLMDYAGGASVVNDYVKRSGIDGVNVRWDENAMNTSDARCRENTSTPAAMAQLMYKFDTEFQDSLSLYLKRIMEACETGTDRLARPLLPTNAVIGHKTGTGPVDKQTGRRMAVNDVGYVHLPNGRRYAIAVFVADSSYDMEETSAIIATLSDIVWKELTAQQDRTK